MAAKDNVSPSQFITIHELRNMQSGDWPNKRVGELRSNQQEGMYQDYDWRKLHQDLDRDGMQTPLTISPLINKLDNGHHRAVAGIERGQMFYPVTTEHTDHEGAYRYTKDLTAERQGHPWAKFHSPTSEPKKYPAPVHPNQGTLF